MKRTFKIELLIENDFDTIEDARAAIQRVYGFVTIKQILDTRTLRQNNAIHLFCQQLADEFNERGLEIQKVLSEEVMHPWTLETVKELIWRPIMQSYLGKSSTTELDKVADISKVYDIINRWLIEKFKIYCPFPSIEYQRTKEN